MWVGWLRWCCSFWCSRADLRLDMWCAAGRRVSTWVSAMRSAWRNWTSMSARLHSSVSSTLGAHPSTHRSECASWSGRSKSIAVARLAAALCLPMSLTSCAVFSTRDPEPVLAQVVCPTTLVDRPCPEPIYVFEPEALSADVAAMIAISEAKARDACARQLAEVQACIRRHNARGASRENR